MDHQSSDSSPRSSISKPWLGQWGVLRDYWSLYGGWRALVTSPYAQVSLAFGIIVDLCSAQAFDPAASTISIVPNVLGFTVGALAIILAFSSAPFFTFLTEEGENRSLFMKTVANFVHFIIVQVLALLEAILTLAHPNWLFKLLSSILLSYAIATTFSIVIQLFQMATVFNASQRPSGPSV